MKIFCLFSVANNYDQPDNNLVCWWRERPSIETLAKALGESFPSRSDNDTLAIVKVWSGDVARLHEVDYRLEEVGEGEHS